MARVMREVLVCDVCGSEEDVLAVTVALDGAERSAELCAEHRRQLQQAVAGVLGESGVAGSRLRLRPRKAAAGDARDGTRTTRKRAASAAAAMGGATQRSRMPRTTCPHCGLEMGVQNLSRHIAAKHPEAVGSRTEAAPMETAAPSASGPE